MRLLTSVFICFIGLSLSLLASDDFRYKSFGIGGNQASSEVKIFINEKSYTIVAYSDTNILKENISLSPENSFNIVINIDNKNPVALLLANNYAEKNIVLKVYDDKDQIVFISNPINLYQEAIQTQLNLGDFK